MLNKKNTAVRDYKATQDPGNVDESEDQLVQFAMENGLNLLDAKLKQENGVGIKGRDW